VNKKRTLLFVCAILIIEAAVIVALPARIPRSARALTAATNVIVAATIWLLARQNPIR
jgi:hypothetical protein